MMFSICARIVFGAAACLAAATTLADGPFRSLSFEEARSTQVPGRVSRVKEGPNSYTSSLATEQEPESIAAPAAAEEDSISAEPEEIWDDIGEGCGDCCEMGPLRCGMWYASVDYLLFRPRLSQGVAGVRRELVTNEGVSPVTSTLTDTSQEFKFPYQSGFRASLGYRLLDCGGDFQVTYWRMTADAQYSAGPADTIADDPLLFGQLKNHPGDGGFLSATTGVTANIFDVDFGKCIALGGPTDCCDPCGGCGCPLWDMRWTIGARVADISRFNNNVANTPAGTEAPTDIVTYGNIDARFVGAGPRVSGQGRRYFGCTGCFSVYGKASQALLIGDYTMSRQTTTAGNQQEPTQITQQFDRFSRMVPVTDIEVGASWQVTSYSFVSAGYFFQCWWDLGQSETIIGTNFGPLDTSNILSFDGLFVRAEVLF